MSDSGKMTAKFIRRKDHIVWNVVDGKTLLLNLENGVYFEINREGLVLWQLCDGCRNREEIIAEAGRKLRKHPIKIEKDANSFIDNLKRSKLVEFVTKATPALFRKPAGTLYATNQVDMNVT